MTLERIAVRDHTLRPNWAQGRAHAILDRAIAAELAREPAYAAEPPLKSRLQNLQGYQGNTNVDHVN